MFKGTLNTLFLFLQWGSFFIFCDIVFVIAVGFKDIIFIFQPWMWEMAPR